MKIITKIINPLMKKVLPMNFWLLNVMTVMMINEVRGSSNVEHDFFK